MKLLNYVLSLIGDPAATREQVNETTSRVCKKATKKVGFKDDIQDIKSDSLNISPSVSNNPKIPTYYLIFALNPGYLQ